MLDSRYCLLACLYRLEAHLAPSSVVLSLRHARRSDASCRLTPLILLLRFEKSLYDLIRGMRNHKGNEREYIQDSIRECRREIKTNDMGELSTL